MHALGPLWTLTLTHSLTAPTAVSLGIDSGWMDSLKIGVRVGRTDLNMDTYGLASHGINA